MQILPPTIAIRNIALWSRNMLSFRSTWQAAHSNLEREVNSTINYNDAFFKMARGCKRLQVAADGCCHLQPLALAATCSHLHLQPLAATCTCSHLHLQPLAATCSHLQPLAQAVTWRPLPATCFCSHLAATCSGSDLAATCQSSHLAATSGSLAATWQPLGSHLAATCQSSHLAATCQSSHLEPLGSHLAATCSHLAATCSHLAATCSGSHVQATWQPLAATHLLRQPLGSHSLTLAPSAAWASGCQVAACGCLFENQIAHLLRPQWERKGKESISQHSIQDTKERYDRKDT